MNKQTINKKIGYITMLLTALLGTGIAKGEQYSAVITFGDSLSDSGNYFHLFREQEIQPFEPDNIPNAPYAVGGHHFTNGETWIEQLTRMLGMADSGSPAAISPGIFHNYAVGRSRARNEVLDDVFSNEGLTSQVDRFLADAGSTAPSDALYVVWIGSNDIADAMTAYFFGDFATGGSIYVAALTNTQAEIGRLYAAGARHFLIAGIPDFSLTPRISNVINFVCSMNPAPFPDFDTCVASRLGNISGLSNGYSLNLKAISEGIPFFMPGSQAMFLDTGAFLHQVTANPEQYGLNNATDSCVAPATYQQVFCQNPNKYLFWDGQHPTKKGHRLLAEYALEQLF